MKRWRDNQSSKLLVICPKSVINQWSSVIEHEFDNVSILKFGKYDTAKIKEDKIKEFTGDILIINFEIISKLEVLLNKITKDWTVIVDESHRIKSPSAVVTKAVLKLGARTHNKIILTATPTQGLYGGYVDYYTQLKFIDALHMKFLEFENKYVKTAKINFGNSPYPVKVITGYRNTDELDAILEKHSRKYKPRFHDYDPEHIKIMLEKPKNYDKAIKQLAYREIAFNNISKKRVGLKSMTGGKIIGYDLYGTHFEYEDNTIKIDWLEEFLEGTDQPVIIFYQYNAELYMIERVLNKLQKSYVTVNGKTEDKHSAIKKKVDAYVGQYQAMSESLDGLQFWTNVMIFYSLPESSLLYRQALGRIDRIGQQSVPIYYYLVCENTVDEKIYDLIERKVEFTDTNIDEVLNESNKT